MRLYFMLKGDERFLEIARSGDINRVVKYVSEVIKNHEY
jgi:hypothetical protein